MTPKRSDSPDRRGSNSDEAVQPRETTSHGSPIARHSVEQPLLTVIILVFNERATVVELLRAVITAPFDIRQAADCRG